MIETILMVIVAVAIAAILFFLLRNGLKLLINAVCGVVILFIVSYFNLAPIGDLSIAQVIVCAVGGILGAALLIILSFFGIESLSNNLFFISFGRLKARKGSGPDGKQDQRRTRSLTSEGKILQT